MVGALKRIYNKTPWQQRRLSQPLKDPNYVSPPQQSSISEEGQQQDETTEGQGHHIQQVSITEPARHEKNTTDTAQGQPLRRGMTRADTKISLRKSKKDSRRVFVNIPPPAQYLDSNGNPKSTYGSNRINTAKYTALTFLPKNLFEQFRRVANMFFLFMAIIQLTPTFTVGSPFLTVFPLCFVVGVTAIKDGFEDYKRHVEDRNFNERLCQQLKNVVNYNYPTADAIAANKNRGFLSRVWHTLTHGLNTGLKKSMRALKLAKKPTHELRELDLNDLPVDDDNVSDNLSAVPQQPGEEASSTVNNTRSNPKVQPEFIKEQWHKLRVGDFILLKNNQAVPADAIILSTSEAEGSCFIETKDLDGETNLKTRMSLHETSKYNTPRRCSRLKCFIDMEPINANLFTFNGSVTMLSRKRRPANAKTASGHAAGPSSNRLSRYSPSITSSMISTPRGSMDEDYSARGSVDEQHDHEGSGIAQSSPSGVADAPAQGGTNASDYARLHKLQKRRSRFSDAVDSSGSELKENTHGSDKQEWHQEPSEMDPTQDDQHPATSHRAGKRSSLYRTATAQSMGRASEMAKNVLKANHEQHLQQQQRQEQQQSQLHTQDHAQVGNSDDKSCPYKETTIPVDINNMLLRGHVIRNTYWVIAVIVATGTETKIMLNSGETPSKRSRIEKTMNIQVALNFLILILLCIVCAVGSSIYDRKWRNTSAEELWDMTSRGVVVEGVITFFTSLIIFQNIIPISLYISIEFVKTFQAYFIWQDSDMYDVDLDQFCTPKTWNLTDDLGQIEYVFSDKTGTLTRNIMEFKKCSINGKIYGNNAVAGKTDGEKGIELMNQSREPGQQEAGESATGPGQRPPSGDSHQADKEAVLQEFEQEVRKLFEPTYMDALEILTFADPEILRDLTGNQSSNGAHAEIKSTSTDDSGNGEGSSSSAQPFRGNRSLNSPAPQHDGSPASNIHDFFTLLALCHTVVIEQPEETVNDDDDDEFGMYDDHGSPGKNGDGSVDDNGKYLTPDSQIGHHDKNNDNLKEKDGQHLGLRDELKQKAEAHGLSVPGASATGGVASGSGTRSRKNSNAASISNLQQEDNGKPRPTICYRAESPDEAALVSAAKNVGFAFVSRGATASSNGETKPSGEKGANNRQNVNLNILGQDYSYEQLDVIKFNSTRKRMTVIVREPAELGGKILLMTKGADNVIFERLSADGQDQDLRDRTEQDIETFSNMGLRTLTLAQRVLDDATYNAWAAKYAEASKALDDRAKKMDQVAEEIECDLTLLGATAIEDKLQEGVPDSIAALREAGIKVWVLTGDKLETAINIGFASRLLEKNMKLEIMKMGRNEAPSSVLQRFKKLVDDVLNGTESTNAAAATSAISQQQQFNEKSPQTASQQYQSQPPQQQPGNTWDEKHLPPTPSDPPTEVDANTQHALIVDGSALKVLLDDPEARKDLIRLSDVCFSVICCRASPLQKALVVELIRRGKKTVCLAIGDGANDVSMIQAANIGVGIAGQEGMQAAMASDYSITQFRFIKKLVLVHGHWGYMRIAEMILNFFFKNVLWVAAVLWFQIYCGFSAMLFYDYTFVSLYNLMLTAVPVLVLGATDQDLISPYILRYPGVYKLGIHQKRYNQYRFVAYMLDGVWQSLVVFWFWRGVFGINMLSTSGIDASLLEFSTSVAITNVIIASLYVGFHTYHWTWIMHFAVWGSITFLVLLILIYGAVPSSPIYHVALQLFSQGSFWFMTVLSVLAALLVRYTVMFVLFWWFPDDVHVVRGIMISEKRNAIAQKVRWTGLAPDGMTPQEQSKQEIALLRKEDEKRKVQEAEKAAKKRAKHGNDASELKDNSASEQPYDLTMIQINVNDHSQEPSNTDTPISNNTQQQQQQLSPLQIQEQLLNQQQRFTVKPDDPSFQYNRRTSSYNYATLDDKPAALPPAPSPSLPSLPTSSRENSRAPSPSPPSDSQVATHGGSASGLLQPPSHSPLTSGIRPEQTNTTHDHALVHDHDHDPRALQSPAFPRTAYHDKQELE